MLDWKTVASIREHGADFATLTHAAGISSTGDDALDARLPFDEAYEIPAATASAVDRACQESHRVVAVGTTVVRALEHAAGEDGHVHAGPGVASQRIGPGTPLRVVRGILTGVHGPGPGHPHA